MDLGISGQTALVLGGTQGLGLACARSLAEAGVKLLVNGRSAAAWEAARGSLPGATFMQGDLAKPEDRLRIIDSAQSLGPVSILVTNAGGPPTGEFLDFDDAAWQQALNANMLAPLALMRAVLPGMCERGWGRIVNITSSSVKAPIPSLHLSSGARAGLTGVVAGVAREVAGRGVTINNLLPGAFATDRLLHAFAPRAAKAGVSVEEMTRQRSAAIPAGRFGDAAEFGATCAFLCSAQAGYITGQNVLIDGGAYPGVF